MLMQIQKQRHAALAWEEEIARHATKMAHAKNAMTDTSWAAVEYANHAEAHARHAQTSQHASLA